MFRIYWCLWPLSFVMMVTVVKNDDKGVWLYIFNDSAHVGIYQSVGVLIFQFFWTEKRRRQRPGADRARVQMTKIHPILSLPILLFSILTQIPPPLPLSRFSLPPLLHQPHFLIPATPSAAFHYVFWFHPPKLSPSSIRSHSPPLFSSHFCPLQRPSLARQGWLQICSSVPWG